MITLNKKDWKKLQWSIVLFVLLTLAGATLVVAATKILGAADKANKRAQAVRIEAKSKAARAHEEEQELREQIDDYQEMLQRGVVGQEHRLDWIEQIRKIKQSRKLIEVNYEIGPQQPISADVAASSLNGFDVMSSPMKLDMQLLHENDLLDFLADLRHNIQGYVRVSKCEVSRAVAAASSQGPAPQLKASCDLGWITIREKR